MSPGPRKSKMKKVDAENVAENVAESEEYDAETAKVIEAIKNLKISLPTPPPRKHRKLSEIDQKTLDSSQNELEAMRARESIPKIVEKFNQLVYNKIKLESKIEHFWITAFSNHPDLSVIIDDSEVDCLYYLDRLKIKETITGYKIEFHFDENPYFENAVLTKEFYLEGPGDPRSKSTPIKWKDAMDLSKSSSKSAKPRGKRNYERKSFFGWFNDHTEPWSDNVAKIIKDDLWKNPLRFYLTPGDCAMD